jgi:DNA-binding Lrp family transcriptional regulator
MRNMCGSLVIMTWKNGIMIKPGPARPGRFHGRAGSATNRPVAIQNRIAKLERDGTIVGYTVRLGSQRDAPGISALMTIAVEGNRAESVLRSLRGDPAVQMLHTTNGRWDVIAELRADTLEAFDRVLGRIRKLEGIANTETSLLLSTRKL